MNGGEGRGAEYTYQAVLILDALDEFFARQRVEVEFGHHLGDGLGGLARPARKCVTF
jgi:hypothetical protein